MLADLRIVLPNFHLFGHSPWVFLGRVEVPGASRALEFDLNGRRFGHDFSRETTVMNKRGNILCEGLLSRPIGLQPALPYEGAQRLG